MQYVLENSTRVVNAIDAHDAASGKQNLNMGAASGGGGHSTSRGTHNLNMTGDMPVAHMLMRELIDRLDAALRLADEPPGEISRLATLVATRTGAGAGATGHDTRGRGRLPTDGAATRVSRRRDGSEGERLRGEQGARMAAEDKRRHPERERRGGGGGWRKRRRAKRRERRRSATTLRAV